MTHSHSISSRILAAFSAGLLLCFALILLLPLSAQAHNRSRGQSEFLVDGHEVKIEITLSAEDVLDLLFVDLRKPAEQEALERGLLQKAVSKNIRRWVKIASAQDAISKEEAEFTPCTLTYDKILRGEKREVFTVQSHAECQNDITFIRIDWGVSSVATLDLAHMGTLLKAQPGKDKPKTLQNMVLSKRENHHILRVQERSAFASFLAFFTLGAEHIALGYDHLAFLLALLLACTTYKRLLLVVSTFTLAHSFTLALAALDIFRLPASIIEPAIAFSIALAALFGLVAQRRAGAQKEAGPHAQKTLRGAVALAFSFGLLHGMGFATLLRESFQDEARVLVPLVAFNLGIEVVQIIFALVFFFLLAALVSFLKSKSPRSADLIYTLLYLILLAVGTTMFISRLLSL